ncbi:MAG: ribonuclease R [Hyphomicrobiales bacterium]|nr:MAG: ribonuclease R [Hyphomicrobiales bacterium]
MPDREAILNFIKESSGRVGKREIARAFNIRGADRIALKRILRAMAEDGLIPRGRKGARPAGGVPKVGVAVVTGRDLDGELMASLEKWDEEAQGPAPRIVVAPPSTRETPGQAAGPGDRILARFIKLEADGPDSYQFEARIIRKIGRAQERAIGIVRRQGGDLVVEPADKKRRYLWPLDAGGEAAKPGDLVSVELSRRSVYGEPHAKVVERHGAIDTPRSFSMIAVEEHGIPFVFPPSVLDEAEAAKPARMAGRTDMRHIPLITIDPADARDHDDAVWAGPDDDPKNPDGFVVLVAIADVASYVTPDSHMDREALKRGNSVYFPDRVVPMLPERISNDLCSLRPDEDRPALTVRMVFDRDGKKRGHQFTRAMIRSAAKLSYQQAQNAFDGVPDDAAAPLQDEVLLPLWAAYLKLAARRDAREPLDLDLPERKIRMSQSGDVLDVIAVERLEAHRLIEEMMIQANVSAAETLEQRLPALYRIHDAPGEEKLRALAEFLQTLDIRFTASGNMTPAHFNRILARVRDSENAELVSQVVLRSQSQAVYSEENHGHFGLNLKRYTHFTSPIRRYADLIVHRALISALGMGDDGITKSELDRIAEIAEEISNHERRAMAAERDTSDRLIASFLQERVGADFTARISGVTRAGLFVGLNETGADGLIPISGLGDDYYIHDEHAHALVGERSGKGYRLGDVVQVRLKEAAPVKGALRFEMLDPPGHEMGKPRAKRGRPGASRRGHRPSKGKRRVSRRK